MLTLSHLSDELPSIVASVLVSLW
ncbi:uncharacterized protein METZ01_LOCUS264156 [marine metagenome]|uniref:Uncharacterized protein n=1 Tax=marine metagenome TaxID=408172 RepID=A0A382JIY1_9ZZZZ